MDGEHDDDIEDDDGWCVDCGDDHGDVLDNDEWLCNDCLLKRYFKLHEEIQTLRKPLAWTRGYPTRVGWYFVIRRDPAADGPYDADCEYFDADDLGEPPALYAGYEFAGPIPEPREA
jgi:hypothetical protein